MSLMNVNDACSAHINEKYLLHMSLIGVSKVLLLNVKKSNNYSLAESIKGIVFWIVPQYYLITAYYFS